MSIAAEPQRILSVTEEFTVFVRFFSFFTLIADPRKSHPVFECRGVRPDGIGRLPGLVHLIAAEW